MRKDPRTWTIETLNSKSASFCAAKWYNASIWLWSGWTTSCHHNPPHYVDLAQVQADPTALHNTDIKKNERRMMKQGEKPVNCQFCWIIEDVSPDNLSDRTWLSMSSATDAQIEAAWAADWDQGVDPGYLEIGFDKTCNLACSYCGPSVSSAWSRDIKRNGAYQGLVTDQRNYYTDSYDWDLKYTYNDQNPLADAFFQWWDQSLHRNLQHLKITGGEPLMSGHIWRLMTWLESNPNQSTAEISLTTNLSYDTELLDRFLAHADNINNRINFHVSGEAMGAKGTYIRQGLDWQAWCANVDHLMKNQRIDSIRFISTINALAAENFAEFLAYVVELKKQRPNFVKISVNPVRFPAFQNIVILPSELRNQFAQEISSVLQGQEHLFDSMELDSVRRIIDYISDVQVPHTEGSVQHTSQTFEQTESQIDIPALQKDFARFFQQYDQRRGLDLAATFPRLADWYRAL